MAGYSPVYTSTGKKVHDMNDQQTGVWLTRCGRFFGVPAGTQRVTCQICRGIRAREEGQDVESK